LDAARELQYRPNAIARGLKLAVTGTLGLLVPSLRNPVNSPIIRGAFDRAWERSFVVVLAEDDRESETAADAYARHVEERRIDGLLIQTARLGDSAHLGAFVTGLVPCVFMDRRHPGSGRNVSMRDGDAGRLACEHFLELGHRSLGHLAGPADLDTVVRRRDGFVGRARSAGIEPVVRAAGTSCSRPHRSSSSAGPPRARLDEDRGGGPPQARTRARARGARARAASTRRGARAAPRLRDLPQRPLAARREVAGPAADGA